MPTPQTAMQITPTDQKPTHRWVACTQDADVMTSLERHLLNVAGGSQGTTLCNASGVGEGVWRANRHKPKCKTCETAGARPSVVIKPHRPESGDLA